MFDEKNVAVSIDTFSLTKKFHASNIIVTCLNKYLQHRLFQPEKVPGCRTSEKTFSTALTCLIKTAVPADMYHESISSNWTAA